MLGGEMIAACDTTKVQSSLREGRQKKATSREVPETLYIFAVNHLPNPGHYGTTLSPDQAKNTPKARSQIDIFKHTLGTSEATYVRSVHHPLIRTPNDLYIENEHYFLVTNDHHHRERLGRMYEDIGWTELAPWSDIIHISNLDLPSTLNLATGFDASVALDKINNPNGLGRGKDAEEIMCARVAPGAVELMHFAAPSSAASQGPKNLTIISQIKLPDTIDNPSYLHDPYAATTGKDASGYVLAGLLKATEFPDAEYNPISVWLVDGTTRQQKLLFQDDGRAINTNSTGVIVAIDPKGNEGRKQAWLFVTGPFSDNLVKTKVDL